eukprot:3941930-Rhodomonas_salina.18
MAYGVPGAPGGGSGDSQLPGQLSAVSTAICRILHARDHDDDDVMLVSRAALTPAFLTLRPGRAHDLGRRRHGELSYRPALSPCDMPGPDAQCVVGGVLA